MMVAFLCYLLGSLTPYVGERIVLFIDQGDGAAGRNFNSFTKRVVLDSASFSMNDSDIKSCEIRREATYIIVACMWMDMEYGSF